MATAYDVGTTSTINPTGQATSYVVFYAATRWWAFWSNGTNMVFDTSTDGGQTWTGSPTSCGAATGYTLWDAYFDGTYLHYVRCATGTLYYRRGTPQSNGTMSWAAAEQTVQSGATAVTYPSVTCCGGGKPTVSWLNRASSTYLTYVKQSSTTDGTFSEDTNVTKSNFHSSSSGGRSKVAGLSTSAFMIGYGTSTSTINFMRWNGSAWQSADTQPFNDAINSMTWKLIGNPGSDTEAYLLYMDSAGDINFFRRQSNNTWTSIQDTGVNGSTTNVMLGFSVQWSSHKAWVAYVPSTTTHEVYYIAYDGTSTWSSATLICTDATGIGSAASSFNLSPVSSNNYIMALYNTETSTYHMHVFSWQTITQVNVDISDGLAFGDSVATPTRILSVMDAMTGSDSPSRLTPKTAISRDLLNLIEQIAKTRQLSTQDSITFPDRQTTQKALAILRDSIGLGEQIARPSRSLSVQDATLLAEQILKSRPLSIQDGLSLNEYIRVQKQLIILDSLNIAEQILRNKTLTMNDQVTLKEYILNNRTLTYILDQQSIGDRIQANKGLLIAKDQLSLIDYIVQSSAGIIKEILDALSTADYILTNKAAIIASDQASLNDLVVRNKSLTMQDQAAIIDLIQRNKSLSTVDQASMIDLIQRSKSLTMQDQISLIESMLRNKALAMQDTVLIAEILSRGKNITAQDALALQEFIKLNKSLIIRDSLLFTDWADKLGAALVEIYDSIAAGDVILTNKSLTFIEETLSMTEQILRNKSISVRDGLLLLDAIQTLKVLVILDSLHLIDSAEKTLTETLRTYVLVKRLHAKMLEDDIQAKQLEDDIKT